MAEVNVIARLVARRGKEDELRELLRGMLAPTRAESGCKLYELYESDSRGRFYFYERWESQAALDRHAETGLPMYPTRCDAERHARRSNKVSLIANWVTPAREVHPRVPC